jgi:uncharacterized alpha-E superfamily protein
MLSRVANSLFWLGRYIERAESSARFLAVTHSYAQELRSVSHAAGKHCWGVARQLLADEGEAPETSRTTFRRLAFDGELATSVVQCLNFGRENARGIRDAIPSELWEELNVLYLRLQTASETTPSETAELALLREVEKVCHLIQGLRDNAMLRGDEWHFLRLGQHLERASITTRILEGMFSHPALKEAAEVGQSIDTLHLVATLKTFTAFEAFSRAGHGLTPESVAEFILLDARMPRSIEFGIQEVGNSLHALSGTPRDIFSNEAEQHCGRLLAELRFASIEEIMAQGFRDYLLRLRQRVDRLGAAIAELYFP